MRGASALLAVAIAAAYSLPGSAAVRITWDPGGQIGPYLDKLQSLQRSGQPVIIDGPCLSACTMVLGLIPPERICVTSRARLGFHAAWTPDRRGRPVAEQEGTAFLMRIYPQQVRDWINRRGGLSLQAVYLDGEELASMYAHCDSSHAVATAHWPGGWEHGRNRVVARSQSVPAARAATIRR